MTNRNKIIIAISVALVVSFLAAYYTFIKKRESFRHDVERLAAQNLLEFNQAKDSVSALLSIQRDFDEEEFLSLIQSASFKRNKDSVFHYLLFTDTRSWEYWDASLLSCVPEIISNSIQERRSQVLLKDQEYRLGQKYPEAYGYWYERLKVLLTGESAYNDPCNLKPTIKLHVYDAALWDDFERLLSYYDGVKAKLERVEQKAQQESDNLALKQIHRFKSTAAKNDFLGDLKKMGNKFLEADIYADSFSSELLGTQEFSISYDHILNNTKRKAFIDTRVEAQWGSYSLATGSMPYAVCYGASNSCPSYNCSQIEVNNYGSDVIVSIKNSSDKVVRHGYINDGDKMTFNVPDGSYKVYFYSGTGWNPEKSMTGSCSELVGGFVNSENVTKDNDLQLNGQIMSYELRLQENGNFSPKQSSKIEAF